MTSLLDYLKGSKSGAFFIKIILNPVYRVQDIVYLYIMRKAQHGGARPNSGPKSINPTTVISTRVPIRDRSEYDRAIRIAVIQTKRRLEGKPPLPGYTDWRMDTPAPTCGAKTNNAN